MFSRFAFVIFGILPVAVSAASVELAGTMLEFGVPHKVAAYDVVNVRFRLTGKGEAVVQAVATDSSAHEQYFDTAIPHEVAFRLECLSNDDERVTFRVTNTGDTIWKADGYGKVTLADFAAPYVYLASDLAPGQSVTKTYPLDRMKRDEKSRFVLTIGRSGSARRRGGSGSVELVLADVTPGASYSTRRVFDAVAPLDDFDELGHAFACRRLDGKSQTAQLNVQVPPWADRLVVRLIKDGQMKAASFPIEVSRESLRLKGNLTRRWTIEGKPIFILRDIATEEIPRLRERFGGANLVLACGAEMDPKSEWLAAVRKYGYKIIPISISYVRLLNWVSQVSGYKLMSGAPAEFEIERVDALDPNFPKAMADVVGKVYSNTKDVLFRTTDGKIPICLSEEQSYGYPWASGYPTRWGGSSAEDVAAFRVWLRQKYGAIGKLNTSWKTSYGGFDEIDPSPICGIAPPDYPNPWKEWGPAIEDFDVFRSKIHGEFWAKTVAQIKKRHPEIMCGLNTFGDYASDTEPIYEGYFDWGVKDYAGRGVNWMARRTGCLPDDLMSVDFFVCWNTGSPEGAKKTLAFWRKRGKDVVIFPRDYAKVIIGGDQEIRTHAAMAINKKGVMIFNHATSFFTTVKATYEGGGVGALLNDPFIGEQMTERSRREIEIFNKEIARAVNESK